MNFGAAAAAAAAAGWHRPHGGVRCQSASLAVLRLMVLALSCRPGLVNVGAVKRLCIIIRRIDEERRCFIVNAGIVGGSLRWVAMSEYYDNWGARSISMPEGRAGNNAARADQLDCLFIRGGCLRVRRVASLESMGRRLKDSGACVCRAIQLMYS